MQRALIADDDPVIAKLLAQVLRRMHLDVITTPRAFGLMNLIVEHRPGIVLVDVRMPALDGCSVVELIRKDPAVAGTLVLLISAMDDDELSRRASGCGADGSISKTLGLDGMERRLFRWVSRLPPRRVS